MDHRAFMAALPAADRARLGARSTRAGLWHLAGHAGAIAALAGLIAAGVPGWPLLLPVLGVCLVFLFTLEHECTHKTPFAHDRLNETVGHACGVILLLPFTWFRYFHLAHHRWTNLPGQDPELDSPKPATRAAWAWHVSGLPYWGAAGALIWRLARPGGAEAEVAATPYLPATAAGRLRREARALLAIYAAGALSLIWSDLLLWLWVLPVLIGQPVLRLYLLAEHGDCPQVADMFANTRTTFTTAVVRFLAWNMPYHVEHHVAPNVPFHQLPQLHRAMRAHLKVTAPGYAAFTRAYLARRH